MLPPIPQNLGEWVERGDGVLSRKITNTEKSSCHIQMEKSPCHIQMEKSPIPIQREKVIQLIEGALRINSAILPAQGTIV